MCGMKISIAMATYNGERFLREQLESIAGQTLQPYELVVTDDGSSDRTTEIVAEFAQGVSFPVRLYRNDERLGYPQNFLKAASLCKGDLIAFSDQDDVWLSEKLARCAESFKDESVMLTIHTGKAVDEDLRPLGWIFPKIGRDITTYPLTITAGMWRYCPGFAMVFRSCLPLVFNGHRPWNSVEQTERMTLEVSPLKSSNHDTWVFFLANVFGKTAYIRQPLVLYRRHSATESNPAPVHIVERVRISLRTRAEDYVERTQVAGYWAFYLEQAAAFLPEEQRLRASKGAHHYRYVEEIFHERSKIYRADEHIWSRFRSLLRLLAQGEYGRQSSIGLGFRTFVKDAAVGVLRIDRFVRKGVV